MLFIPVQEGSFSNQNDHPGQCLPIYQWLQPQYCQWLPDRDAGDILPWQLYEVTIGEEEMKDQMAILVVQMVAHMIVLGISAADMVGATKLFKDTKKIGCDFYDIYLLNKFIYWNIHFRYVWEKLQGKYESRPLLSISFLLKTHIICCDQFLNTNVLSNSNLSIGKWQIESN